ncbi:MAG: DUF1211 domain-containing protein [Bacteroidetes bacterium]|nr:DUF1211 domain-containing protein [Bacteroidota bacterium]
MPHKKIDYNLISGQKIQRTEALADGVFAVAMTLLVLDIKVPISDAIHSEADLLTALGKLLPTMLSYFMSFMTLGIFWMAHSSQYSYIERTDRHLNWISIFYLMFVSLVPFTTAFINEHDNYRLSIGLYWLNILMLGILIYIHWSYAYRHNFIASEFDKEAINKAIKKRILIAQTLYAFGALLCFINTNLSIGVILLVQINYAFAFSFRKKKIK